MKPLYAIALSGALAASACMAASSGDDAGGASTQVGALRPLERAAIGRAADYKPDTTLRAKLDDMTKSRSLRREEAWKAVERALAPVAIAAKTSGAGVPSTLPTFRTWYGHDDFERIFGKMYGDLPAADRKARRPFTADEIKSGFDWNATSLGASSETDFFKRVAALTDDATVEGLGGNNRVVYSPGIFEHLLGQYGALDACAPGSIAGDAAPADVANQAPCFTAEFPESAAIFKMSWYRANFGDQSLPLPTYATDAKTLAGKVAGTDADKGGWGDGAGTADPDASSIYTVTMADGARFRMPAMHLVTKELRDWLWITLWWSPSPDEDFGADRPASIAALGGPWKNYKMNVVVSYDEEDPDPRGGFDGSLGDALAATYAGKGGPTWASDPYLEKGAPNAQSNCIGCHQHAGTTETTESILAAPDRFPMTARTQLRKNFPTDYLWAMENGQEDLRQVIDDQIQHYDQVDR